MMEVSIVDHQLQYDTHNTYSVTVDDTVIHTLVTHTPYFVDDWISDTLDNYPYGGIIGLDVEWRPNFNRNFENPVATLQLCIGNSCLIFQLIHAPFIPQSLFDFLANPDYQFVGVNVHSDCEKLMSDYGLSVDNAVDLRLWAADIGRRDLMNAGIRGLSRVFLGKDIEKPSRITLSRWDYRWLSPDQVQYACVDAFISCEIGVVLNDIY